MQAKYIIIEEMGLEIPIVFGYIINHIDVARNFNMIISAGFCSQTEMRKWKVWGESKSLQVKSRPEDVEILNKYLEM